MHRPTYPKVLYDTVYAYHASSKAAQWDVAVDLGCGTGKLSLIRSRPPLHFLKLTSTTGQATTVLAERFNKVIGVDPSKGMIKSANENPERNTKLEFVTSSAEVLPFLANESVDLATAG